MNITKLSRKLKALSDPTRLKILYLVNIRPLCVCELTKLLKLSQPTLTRHLQRLEEGGFITSSRHKFYNIYTINFEDEETRRLAELVLTQIEKNQDMKELEKEVRETKPIYLL